MTFIETLQKLVETNMEILLLSLVFIVVMLVLLAGGLLFSGNDPIENRVQSTNSSHSPRSTSWFFGFSENKKQEQDSSLKNEKMVGLSYNLAEAGFKSRHAPLIYSISQIFLGIGLGSAVYIGLTQFAPEVRLIAVIALSAGNAVIGFMLPNVFLSRRKAARILEIEHSFPDALDMLLVSMEAGASLDGALNRVGKEISQAHPLLSEHLNAIGQELRAGTSREAAFRRFAKKIPIEDVRSFVALFVQTDRLGTSVALALRVHAEEMRLKRVLRAEEKAHQLPVKLSVPLVLFILPALLIVIMTPAIIRIARNFIF